MKFYQEEDGGWIKAGFTTFVVLMVGFFFLGNHMKMLDHLFVRIFDADIAGGDLFILTGVGIFIFYQKRTGHRIWFRMGIVAAVSWGVSSFVTSWDIYHQSTKLISVFATIRAVALTAFTARTIIDAVDLRRTFQASEDLDRLRKDKVESDQNKVVIINAAAADAQEKSLAMLQEVQSRRRR